MKVTSDKRLVRSLLAVGALMVVAIIAVISYPYFRERAALRRLADAGVVVEIKGFENPSRAPLVWPPRSPDANAVLFIQRGPQWLHSFLGRSQPGPFDRISKVKLLNPGLLRTNPAMRVCDDLERLRHIDQLNFLEGAFTDEERARLEVRFPSMAVYVSPKNIFR